MKFALTRAQLGRLARTCRGELTQAVFAKQIGLTREQVAKAELGTLPGIAARIIERCTGARYIRTEYWVLSLK